MNINLNDIIDQVIANPPVEGEDQREYNKRMSHLMHQTKSTNINEWVWGVHNEDRH